jgi:hypothetical protein
MEIELIQDGGQIKREIDIYHHAWSRTNVYHLSASRPSLFLIGHYIKILNYFLKNITMMFKKNNAFLNIHTIFEAPFHKVHIQKHLFGEVCLLLQNLFCFCYHIGHD